MKRLIAIISIVLIGYCCAEASTIITAQITRNQIGSGSTFISSGFPLPPGLVTESIITDGTIKIIVNGSEVAANVSALRGRHSDGTIRSILIQFASPASMTQGDILAATVVINGGVRTSPDPAYQRPTLTTVQNNNVILPTDAAYLASTLITFQHLLPTGQGTAAEEKQYTTLANYGFDALVVSQNEGTANYEEVRGIVALWARTGNIKYFNEAVAHIQKWLDYDTLPVADGTSRACKNDAVINPDGRPTSRTDCTTAAEPYFSRSFSYASMYLLTGYRDFWGMVADHVQTRTSYGDFNDQATAESLNIPRSGYDAMRGNYAANYGGLMAAYMIDATIKVDHSWYSGAVFTNWQNQFAWVLNAFENTKWDFKWIPFNGGTGTVPVYGTTITQGGATATLRGVYEAMHDRQNYAGNAMPASGYILINNTSGFSAGALTFSSGTLTASATGSEITDYRQGVVGTRVDSPRTYYSPPYCLPTFQMIFPMNFLIDYYLNINADTRIPEMVKTNIDVYLKNIHPLVVGDRNYGDINATWGNPIWGNGYPLENPVDRAIASPWNLAEFPRMIAFILKTVPGAEAMTLPDADGNTASYATWYSRLIDTSGNYALVNSQWKLFGQFYGFGSDTPWIMAQSSLPAPSFRAPTNYASIPGDIPDLGRSQQQSGKRYRNARIVMQE